MNTTLPTKPVVMGWDIITLPKSLNRISVMDNSLLLKNIFAIWPWKRNLDELFLP